jgi:hypothetical protein
VAPVECLQLGLHLPTHRNFVLTRSQYAELN